MLPKKPLPSRDDSGFSTRGLQVAERSAAAAAVPVVAVHFEPNARIRIGFEPMSAGSYGRPGEHVGIHRRTAGIGGQPRLQMLRLRVKLVSEHRASAAVILCEDPDGGGKGAKEHSGSNDIHLQRHGYFSSGIG